VPVEAVTELDVTTKSVLATAANGRRNNSLILRNRYRRKLYPS